jgi:hypothetical protein
VSDSVSGTAGQIMYPPGPGVGCTTPQDPIPFAPSHFERLPYPYDPTPFTPTTPGALGGKGYPTAVRTRPLHNGGANAPHG